MTCENLQISLSIYFDDVLTDDERIAVDAHLGACPLCRQKLSDFQSMRQSLRMMRQPELSVEMLNSVRNRVDLAQMMQPFQESFSAKFRAWAKVFLMPYAVGTVASLLFGFIILWGLLTANSGNREFAESPVYEAKETTSILLARATPRSVGEFDLSAADFARERISISFESPSVNPQGALVALTKSFIRGEMKDEEVVVVADVFGNGLAQIAEVVEPSKDRHAVRELEKALKTNPDFAPPFVPANMDNRSNVVRVVLKFQTVEVDTKKSISN